MNMVYGLATILSRIDHGAIAFLQSFRAGNLCRGPMQMANQGIVLFPGMGDGSYVFAGNNEDVDGGLRMDVGERIALFILIDSFGWNASIDDLAKYAAHS
jgi:hypothetical protein